MPCESPARITNSPTTQGVSAREGQPEWPVLGSLAIVDVMSRQQSGNGALHPGATHSPDHLPSGAALLALALGEEARGVRGLDVLRRSVDRAPPTIP